MEYVFSRKLSEMIVGERIPLKKEEVDYCKLTLYFMHGDADLTTSESINIQKDSMKYIHLFVNAYNAIADDGGYRRTDKEVCEIIESLDGVERAFCANLAYSYFDIGKCKEYIFDYRSICRYFPIDLVHDVIYNGCSHSYALIEKLEAVYYSINGTPYEVRTRHGNAT